ncbi:wee1-like protein kinase [Selaginella moellendorffii]|uniref:wee1-like protein kinase n=1 Tax=Selaginella moellendorffii TaxID=88036 RepID=UPI000D1CE52F|nr:wee1-like protein kinase [Selaginella moellendorffii]|eukprot:XP_002985199.2 wee1-like protein kinase [Selaginella moellendorffii]
MEMESEAPAAAQDLQSDDMICSQDFLCTADYVTPVEQQFTVDFNASDKNAVLNVPVGLTPLRSKRPRSDEYLNQEAENAKTLSLRQRVMSPPCFRNPFVNSDVFPERARQGCVSAFGSSSRYREEFHQIKEIGRGDFSYVYEVLKRLDGCLYAVKHSNRRLLNEGDRRKALREVQALSCLGYHENVVRYFSSWFENDFLYIQMELCETNLRDESLAWTFTEKKLTEAMFQLLNALKHLHSHGLAHLDVKPDNIYIRKGVYKIGDFGLACRIDGAISIEDGDSRYLPMELINDDHSHLDKADMFSLGATFYELARRSPLPASGSQYQAIRQGKLALLPGFSLVFQSLIKSLMHPAAKNRPSAAQALKNALFKKSSSKVL